MNKNSGFSLVELVVVIAIMVVLATGIAVLWVNHVSEAEKNKTLANCCTVVECTQIIASDNSDAVFEAPYNNVLEMSEATGNIEKIVFDNKEITYLRYKEKYTVIYENGKYKIVK